VLNLTGLSRQFAFAQFTTVESAGQFLERHYPIIQLFGPYDPAQANNAEGSKVRIAFSREKEDRDRAGKNEDDWKCDVVCKTPPTPTN
jgi:RNA-binding protein 5/10